MAGYSEKERSDWWERVRLDLSAPFRMDQVQWRAQAGPWKKGDGHICLCIPYIDARHVQGRLDRVLGPGNWALDYKAVGADTFAGIGILDKYTGAWVWKWDTGHKDMASEWGAKGTASDAQKRAAVQWGLGRYLYGMQTLKLACTVKETKQGLRVKQITGKAKPADFQSWAVAPKEWAAWENATGLTVPDKVRDALLGNLHGEPGDLAGNGSKGPQEGDALTCVRCGHPVEEYKHGPTGRTYSPDGLIIVSKTKGRPGPWCGYCHFQETRPAETDPGEPEKDIAHADFWFWVSRSYCRAAGINWQDPEEKAQTIKMVEATVNSMFGCLRAAQAALLDKLAMAQEEPTP